jgi:hypothetical protein
VKPRFLLLPGAVAIAALAAALWKGAAPATPAPPSPAAAAPPGGWFEERAEAVGVTFRQGHRGKSPLPVLETMGTGCAVQDFDGDGHPDLLLIGQPDTGNTGKCALYRNRGDGTFEDVTAGSGLESPGLYMGCAAGDLDNDGLPDLLITGYGVCRLFRNLGKLRFKEVTAGSGLEARHATDWATSAGFADVNGDGRLDAYVGRYVIFDDKTLRFCDYGGVQASCGPKFYDPQFGGLYLNSGGFRFTERTRQLGITVQQGKCLGVVFHDVNDDGWPDLYLANDEMEGELFVNDHGRRFASRGMIAGVALSADGQVQGGMGVDFADVDRNGKPDLFVTTYETEAASLYLNRGGTLFEHASLACGIDQVTRTLVGFGTRMVDVDNDGWSDIAIANGHIHDNQEQVDSLTQYRQPMQLLMNRGGTRFEDRTPDAGPGFSTPAVGRGMASGDLDADGKLDLVVTDLEGPARVLFNRTPGRGSWLRVHLRGTHCNRQAIGARVTVVAGKERWVGQVQPGGSYLSSSDPRLHFGLGGVTAIDRVEVRWPCGRTSLAKSPRMSNELELQEPR